MFNVIDGRVKTKREHMQDKEVRGVIRALYYVAPKRARA